jgi:hypothetical protein
LRGGERVTLRRREITPFQRFKAAQRGEDLKVTVDRREEREEADHVKKVRLYVFARERNVCRICRFRPAESMHELKFRSAGGKVSKANSVAVCGDGVQGCHGFAQRHEIRYRFEHDGLGAESTIHFTPVTHAASEQMRIMLHEWIVSPVMSEVEAEL